MRVFVLGHRGMLGAAVEKYLSDCGYDVVTSTKRYEGIPADPLLKDVSKSEAQAVINAVGAIPQKTSDSKNLYLANAVFPLHLACTLKPEVTLIHASTDCVFSGARGQYGSSERTNATNAYGLSKAFGETVISRLHTFVFRTSIIGPELNSATGLMAWFLSQKGEVNGYTNHFWNGITILEWAKQCESLLSQRWTPTRPLIQLGTGNKVSKYELLLAIKSAWNTPANLNASTASDTIDRTLVPDRLCPPIKEQLAELKSWMSTQKTVARAS